MNYCHLWSRNQIQDVKKILKFNYWIFVVWALHVQWQWNSYKNRENIVNIFWKLQEIRVETSNSINFFHSTVSGPVGWGWGQASTWFLRGFICKVNTLARGWKTSPFHFHPSFPHSADTTGDFLCNAKLVKWMRLLSGFILFLFCMREKSPSIESQIKAFMVLIELNNTTCFTTW